MQKTLLLLLISLLVSYTACVPERMTARYVNADVSPDGRTLVYNYYIENSIEGRSALYLMDLATLKTKYLYEPAIEINYSITPKWSPDGTRILLPGGMIYLKNNEFDRFYPHKDIPIYMDANWSPDGASILFHGYDSFYLCDSLFENKRKLPIDGENPRWMNDGADILYTKSFDAIHLIDTLGNNHRELINDGNKYYTPVCSPNGIYIAFRQNKDLQIINLESGEEIYLDKGENPAWTSDSRSIVYELNDNKEPFETHLWKIDIETKARIKLTK